MVKSKVIGGVLFGTLLLALTFTEVKASDVIVDVDNWHYDRIESLQHKIIVSSDSAVMVSEDEDEIYSLDEDEDDTQAVDNTQKGDPCVDYSNQKRKEIEETNKTQIEISDDTPVVEEKEEIEETEVKKSILPLVIIVIAIIGVIGFLYAYLHRRFR